MLRLLHTLVENALTSSLGAGGHSGRKPDALTARRDRPQRRFPAVQAKEMVSHQCPYLPGLGSQADLKT